VEIRSVGEAALTLDDSTRLADWATRVPSARFAATDAREPTLDRCAADILLTAPPGAKSSRPACAFPAPWIAPPWAAYGVVDP